MLNLFKRAAIITKINCNLLLKNYPQKCTNNNNNQWTHNNRGLWGYVAIAFNRVDENRLKIVGPDRLCAEWLLKNGGQVGFLELPNRLIKDYNCLPPENAKLHVKVVDATKSSIMKIGLEHFVNCKHIDTVIFDECLHLEEDGLEGLLHLKDTLKILQVSQCYNMTDEGLKVIGGLSNLKELRIYDFKYVKNLNEVLSYLKKQLPNCKISNKSDC